MLRRVLLGLGLAAAAVMGAALFRREPLAARALGRPEKASVADRLEQYGEAARARLAPAFAAAGVAYPPAEVALLAFKLERRLDLVARSGTEWRLVKSYPWTATSGTLGPKLREGDGQIPEGQYRVTYLNPNSSFHLSLRLGYPNSHDRTRAARDGRTGLGGDIMIHGNAVSIGCIPIGDPAIEEVFVLVADVGMTRTRVVLSPLDFRVRELPPEFSPPTAWTAELYREIQAVLAGFPRPGWAAPSPASPRALLAR